ncbi:hypothetical protein psal_cds_320 [Pandoravirus salinus]|uniref:Uncharacterized protein n=1 Tax=Pandoravirus salinus TaxID=1349410 RepID=S4VUB9_9VIRU|nr:hypothetical protein psal_cds_320 [Pandoravirus salinus]AGO83943.1 hypothetical protein psal_cds_320 [Pandoravirus salinus]
MEPATVATTTATTADPATGEVVRSRTLSVTPSTARELLRNEIIIGAGITLLGGAIGFGYGLWKNSSAKRSGSAAVESDLLAAFEGAILGLIIALVAVLLYRSFFHGQALYHQARLQQQEALARAQAARLQHYVAAAPAAAAAAAPAAAPAVTVARTTTAAAANPAVRLAA